MADHGFDTRRSDELVHKLGSAIVRAPGYQRIQWDAIVLVVEAEDESMFGYVYRGGDEWQAAGPGDFSVLDLALELRQAMRIADKPAWRKCLVRISRRTGKIDIDFDYEGSKWVPDMANPESFARSLRE